MNKSLSFYSALEDFHRERRLADLQVIFSRLTGKPVDLLSFDDVAAKLKLAGRSDRGLQEIPVAAIIGSAGRYSEFTRTFLPKASIDSQRWARVKTEMVASPGGLPPIEVYKIDESYFVKDGHHRVSVARQLGMDTIQAYVTEVRTKIPLTPDISPEELILRTENLDFLEHTHLKEIYPSVELTVSIPGLYPKLEEHIHVHRYFMGLDQQRDISLEEAVRDWYETEYRPVVEAIEERGVLYEFPGMTVTDLYIWISEHRYLVEQELGWRIRSDKAADDLIQQMSANPARAAKRIRRNVIDHLISDELEGNKAGKEGEQMDETGQLCIFYDFLVPVSGEEIGWSALEQAFMLARCEGSTMHGIHILPGSDQLASASAQGVKERFDERCRQAGISGSLALVKGEVSQQVVEKAVFADLVVLNVAHPPASNILSRLDSGLQTIVQRCPRPILAVPGKATSFDRLLLGYDGSPKSRQALYVSAFMAGKWGVPLHVVTVVDPGRDSAATLRSAQDYLEARQIQAEYHLLDGQAGTAILNAAQLYGTNLILVGGYGFSAAVEIVLGSAIEVVLQETEVPVLICP
ncbi:MAG: universal stress protein [Chloroflexi bacterium]|nr:universal stress protein [Chloroflexota bacterium]